LTGATPAPIRVEDPVFQGGDPGSPYMIEFVPTEIAGNALRELAR